MTRLHTTAAALMILAIATPGCTKNRNLPTKLAPSQVTTLAINSYLWRAAIDTVSFAPLLQANAQSGVIITDWYRNPKTPNERVKLTVAVLDPDLRSDAIRVSAAKQVYQNGAWLDAPVRRVAATDTFVGYAPRLEDAILPQIDTIRAAIQESAKF